MRPEASLGPPRGLCALDALPPRPRGACRSALGGRAPAELALRAVLQRALQTLRPRLRGAISNESDRGRGSRLRDVCVRPAQPREGRALPARRGVALVV